MLCFQSKGTALFQKYVPILFTFFGQKIYYFCTMRFIPMFHIADNQDCQQVNEVSQDCFFLTFSKKQYGKPINSMFYQIKQKMMSLAYM